MNKKCFAWALLLVSLAVSTVFAKDYALRKVYWGMTKAQVKAAEKDKLIKEVKDELIYSTHIKKYPFELEYDFYMPKDALHSAKLELKTKGSGKIFFDLTSMLKLKYGEPISEKNDEYGREMVWYKSPSNIAITYEPEKKRISIYYFDFSETAAPDEINEQDSTDKL